MTLKALLDRIDDFNAAMFVAALNPPPAQPVLPPLAFHILILLLGITVGAVSVQVL